MELLSGARADLAPTQVPGTTTHAAHASVLSTLPLVHGRDWLDSPRLDYRSGFRDRLPFDPAALELRRSRLRLDLDCDSQREAPGRFVPLRMTRADGCAAQVLWAISSWILVRKVRSQALICVFRFYYFLLYNVFYRTLFARLRSPDQAVYITLLSSVLVVAWYPISMSKTCWRILRRTVGVEPEWEEYAANRGTELYIRNVSENVTSSSVSAFALSSSFHS